MFTAIGERPQWEIIYERLSTMDIGDVIKDVDLTALLPDAPETSVRGAFWRAVKQVEDDHKRTFDRVRLVGYRMVAAKEHEGLARRQHKRAKRRMVAAQRKAHSADRTQLTTEERRRLDAVEDHLGRQMEMIRRLDARQVKTEQRVARTEKDSAEIVDRIDQLTQLLERHGISHSDAGPGGA